MIAEKGINKLVDKEEALSRYINQISNIVYMHNKKDAAMMVKRLKESAKRIGILKELEQRLKILDLIKGEK